MTNAVRRLCVFVAFVGGVASHQLFGQSCPQWAPSGGAILANCGSFATPCPVGQPVAFTIIPSNAPAQSCDTVHWSFGDFTTPTTTGAYSATHTYAQALSSAFVSATISNSLGTG